MGVPDGVVLRAAVPEDALAGAVMHQAVWREAYGEYVDAALLSARLADLAGWTQRWLHQIEHGPPRVVAETEEGGLVGFACAGPARDEEPVADLELYAIYARRAWWGTGLGPTLLAAVVPSGASCSLWVLEANIRARAFYRRHGFEPDGATLHDEGLAADEVRLLRSVTGG